MDDKMIDRILDNLIAEAGPIAIDNMTKEDLKTLDDASGIEFSKKHEAEMKKIFAEAKRREMMPKRMSLLKKVAVFAAITIVVSGATIGSVGAWRESFVKYFLEMKEEYSESDKIASSYDIIVDNIYFGYIPNSFEYESIDTKVKTTVINFKSENQYIKFKIKKPTGGNKINTESGDVNDIIIGEKEMVYSENDIVKFLTWEENDNINVLQSDCTKQTLIKIAENIKFLD